jgi:hypothetical protein
MDGAVGCGPARGCVFSRALLAHAAGCGLAQRRSVGEREQVECGSPVAHMNCETLAALMHERARFALRLPRAGSPLMHAQAMRLQCGGLAGLAQVLQAPASDVHALVALAQARHGGLAELPWDGVVAALRAWVPRRRRRAP